MKHSPGSATPSIPFANPLSIRPITSQQLVVPKKSTLCAVQARSGSSQERGHLAEFADCFWHVSGRGANTAHMENSDTNEGVRGGQRCPAAAPGLFGEEKGWGWGLPAPCPLLLQASTFPVISPESFFLLVKPVVGSQKISVECLIAAGVVFCFFFSYARQGGFFPAAFRMDLHVGAGLSARVIRS